jgi:hypothetical protein
LHGLSVVKCCNLFTVSQADIHRIIGRLSEATMTKLFPRWRFGLVWFWTISTVSGMDCVWPTPQRNWNSDRAQRPIFACTPITLKNT